MNTLCHSRVMASRVTPLILAMAFLTQCSGQPKTEKQVNDLPQKTVEDSFKAATSPLDDMGLREEEIPEPLLKALKNPYAGSAKMECAAARKEVAALDAILGPDMEAQPLKTTSSANDLFEIPEVSGDMIVETGADMAHDAVVGFVRSQTSFLPFRGIIRSITGASKHEKEVAQAQQAGQLRRAYIKGLMHATGKGNCFAPAPSPKIQEASVVVGQ